MSKKQKNKHRKSQGHQSRPYDHRRGDAITVAWVIGALACGLAGAVSGVGIYLTRGSQFADQASVWQAITPLMLFIGAITGFVVVCLTPLVYLFRRTAPPMVITVIALAVAAFPLVALIMLTD